MTARGIRLNNPGNIRHSADRWQGMSTAQPDSDFVKFDAMRYGCRALIKTLRTYVEKWDRRTVRKIIERWAPPSENNTESYILHVSAAVRHDPDDLLNVRDDPLIYLDLAKAIARHECGPDAEAISDDVWEVAMKEAGL